MIVMELVSGGSLDSYLVKHAETITVSERIGMCLDAAKGIEYLHEKNCIHRLVSILCPSKHSLFRDVAARNCLVDDGKIKISDFGLTRELSQSKVFKLENLKQRLPIRWLSPETLTTASYTFKSDVFSYGILMWEVSHRLHSRSVLIIQVSDLFIRKRAIFWYDRCGSQRPSQARISNGSPRYYARKTQGSYDSTLLAQRS